MAEEMNGKREKEEILAWRMQKIHCRTAIQRHKKEKRIISYLSVSCFLLMIGIGGLLQQMHVPGVAMVEGGFGSVLLRNGAEAYVLIGIIAFVLGVGITVLCIRFKNKQQKK